MSKLRLRIQTLADENLVLPSLNVVNHVNGPQSYDGDSCKRRRGNVMRWTKRTEHARTAESQLQISSFLYRTM